MSDFITDSKNCLYKQVSDSYCIGMYWRYIGKYVYSTDMNGLSV